MSQMYNYPKLPVLTLNHYLQAKSMQTSIGYCMANWALVYLLPKGDCNKEPMPC
jgi:hypothetical protein